MSCLAPTVAAVTCKSLPKRSSSRRGCPVSLRRRLARLEALPRGRCPGCNWRADDIRTVYFGSTYTLPDGSTPPLVEVVARDDLPDQPDRPRCTTCGLYAPPVEFVDLDE